jgi:hypothetical protein
VYAINLQGHAEASVGLPDVPWTEHGRIEESSSKLESAALGNARASAKTAVDRPGHQRHVVFDAAGVE